MVPAVSARHQGIELGHQPWTATRIRVDMGLALGDKGPGAAAALGRLREVPYDDLGPDR